MPSNRYPIDLDAVHKGQEWTERELAEATGTEEGTTDYVFAVLALKQRIERHLAAVGRPATVCLRRGSLCVLSDSQALDYNKRAFALARRKLTRSFERMAAISIDGLTSEERDARDQEMARQGLQVLALENARKQKRLG